LKNKHLQLISTSIFQQLHKNENMKKPSLKKSFQLFSLFIFIFLMGISDLEAQSTYAYDDQVFGGAQADLIIKDMRLTGDYQKSPDGKSLIIPVIVSVENRGNKTAGTFLVSVHAANTKGTFVRPFVQHFKNDSSFPKVRLLGTGHTTEIKGFIVLQKSDPGFTRLFAVADSSIEQGINSNNTGVIDESNENNNISKLIRLPEINQ